MQYNAMFWICGIISLLNLTIDVSCKLVTRVPIAAYYRDIIVSEISRYNAITSACQSKLNMGNDDDICVEKIKLRRERLRTFLKQSFKIAKTPEFRQECRHSNEKCHESEKKIISISPAGLRGFYSLGVAMYIKETYDLDDVIFSGASAGSWVALYMAHKGDPLEIPLQIMEYNYERISSVSEFQVVMKQMFLDTYTLNDYDMSKLYIGVTGLHNFQLITNIYSNFESLTDALDACIASSHIPFVSGGLITKYNNMISFDGGLSSNPYVNFSTPILHINPNMWESKDERRYLLEACSDDIAGDLVSCYTGLQVSQLENVSEMIEKGYNDTAMEKDVLDSIFLTP